MSKYTKYLKNKHDWNSTHCLSLIEQIYEEQNNKDFSKLWDKLGTKEFDKRWFTKYNLEFIETELENWQKISLTNIQEYDILIFSNGKNAHFGMYIGLNKFIHVEENSYATISELDQDFRDLIVGIVRV